MKQIIFLIMTFIFVNATFSAFKLGNALLEQGKEWNKWDNGQEYSFVDAGIYTGYVVGVHDCSKGILIRKIPDDVTIRQLCSVVYEYLKSHPAELNKPDDKLVLSAIKKLGLRRESE